MPAPLHPIFPTIPVFIPDVYYPVSTKAVERLEDIKYPPPRESKLGNSRKEFIERMHFLFEKVPEKTLDLRCYEILNDIVPERKSLIDSDAIENLELMAFGKTFDDKLKKIGCQLSRMGRRYFLLELMSPTNDEQFLIARQTAIKTLIFSKNYLKDLSKFCNDFRDNEDYILSILNKNPQELPQRLRNYYPRYSKKLDAELSENPAVINYVAYLSLAKKVANIAAAVLLSALMLIYIPHILLGSTAPIWVKNNLKEFLAAGGPLWTFLNKIPVEVLSSLAKICGVVAVATNFEKTLEALQIDLDLESAVLKVVSHWAAYFKLMEQLHSYLEKAPELLEQLAHFKQLDTFLKDPELQPLFKILRSNTFVESTNPISQLVSRYFYNRGNLLAAYFILSKESVRIKFRQALLSILEINSLVAAANLYSIYQKEGVPVCFPEYDLESKAPYIKAEDLVNPLVTGKPIPNSLEIGEGCKAHNMLISAPNASGKSTLLKAVLGLTVLNRLGFVFARSMKATPFTSIFIYANPADSIAQDQSLFQKQISLRNRVHAISEDLEKNGGRGLFVLDEFLSGTGADGQAELLKKEIEVCRKYANSIYLLITHNSQVPPHVAEIEKTEGDGTKSFKNYHIVTETTEPYQRLYTIEEGPFDPELAKKIAVYMSTIQPNSDVLEP